MPVTVKRIEEGPRPTRNKRSVLEQTEEFRDVKAALADGIKVGEAAFAEFTQARQKELGLKNVGRAFRDLVRAYVRRLGMSYDVERFHSEGAEVVRVMQRVVLAPSRTGKPESLPTHPVNKQKRRA